MTLSIKVDRPDMSFSDSDESAAIASTIRRTDRSRSSSDYLRLYRLLSGMTHISTETIDAYLHETSFPAGTAVSIKTEPEPTPLSVTWAHLIACCMMWSGRVVDYLDARHTRRSDLRRAARELGVTDVLAVRYSAHQRVSGSPRAGSS